jgi:hypothetical protein
MRHLKKSGYRITKTLLASGIMLVLMSSFSVTERAQAGPHNAASDRSGIAPLLAQMRVDDFRVRVQAALLLGKLAQPSALPILLRGLNDSSAAVRAASAAALGIFGDPAALRALAKLSDDPSKAVRRTSAKSVLRLKKELKSEVSERPKAQLLVHPGAAPRSAYRSPDAFAAAVQATRRALRNMEGVSLLRPSENPNQLRNAEQIPILVIHPSIQSLKTRAQGDKIIVSAKVEFVVQGKEKSSILGRLSGRASASGLKLENKSKGAAARLEGQAVSAAAHSAIHAAKGALLRAAARS